MKLGLSWAASGWHLVLIGATLSGLSRLLDRAGGDHPVIGVVTLFVLPATIGAAVSTRSPGPRFGLAAGRTTTLVLVYLLGVWLPFLDIVLTMLVLYPGIALAAVCAVAAVSVVVGNVAAIVAGVVVRMVRARS